MSIKEGKLEKLGAKFPSWKKRFFVLKDNTLAYYKDKSAFKKVRKPKIREQNSRRFSDRSRILGQGSH